MFSAIQNTPPEIAFLLGFFLCQGLKRSRVNELISLWLPSKQNPHFGTTTDTTADNDS
jgi:hypothetical protein